MRLFCPTECSLLPDPNFRCHILYSAFIYCLLSIYTTVQRDAICHFPQHFPSLYGWVPFFFSLKRMCFSSFITDCTLQSVPSVWGPFISPLPFLVLHVSPPSSVGFSVLFLSQDFLKKIPPTANAWLPFLLFFLQCSACISRHSVQNFDGKSCLHLDFSS